MMKLIIRTKNKSLASFTHIIISTIDNIRNIKCKHPDIDAIYRYVSKTVATNLDRDFIETIVVELVNKSIIFNKPAVQGLDLYVIVNGKENLEVTNSAIANENINSNSNISSDINKSSSNENTPDKIHADNTEKENTIQNSASANKKLSSSFSITSENAPTISRNVPLINCTDVNVNGNTIKNSADIPDDIGPLLLHNIDTPLLSKHGQSNTELQALKNYILKIEAQISALKYHVKCELSTLTNKTETMLLNLLKMAIAQQESVNKNVELLQQNISFLQKELTSKNETIKSLL